MKTRDLSEWQGQRASLASGGEISRAFLEFLEAWVESAEQLVAVVVIDPADALRNQLPLTEGKFGRCPAHMLGSMLAVLAQHWDCGPEMMDGLTPVERRLVEDMLLLKIEEQEQQAKETPNGADR